MNERVVIMNENDEKKGPSLMPIALALVLIVSSVIYIAFRTMSNKAYNEKWKDYDECGLG